MDELRKEWLKKIDPSFAYWLSGFSDGEGYFAIRKRETGKYYNCAYSIHIRADDKCVLYDIYSNLGFGSISQEKICYGNDNLCAKFTVANKLGCLHISDLFTEYPLQSKKHKDFLIWKNAVRLWNDHKFNEPWENIKELYEKIREQRNYTHVELADCIV